MKRFRIIAVLLCLIMSITSMAQSPLEQTITSSGGLTLEYPANYIGEANEALAVGLLDIEEGIFMIIGVDEASYSFTGEEADTSEALKDGFVNTLSFLGSSVDDDSIQDMQMNDRPAFLIAFDSTSLGLGHFLAFELPDGTPASALIIAPAGREIPSVIVEDLQAIAASVTLDTSLAIVEEAEITEVTSTDLEDSEDDVTETDEADSIPEDAILVADFPEGMILTGSGLQMTTLDGFDLLPGTEFIENSVGLVSNNFQNSVIMIDMGQMTEEDRDLFVQGTIPLIALMSGNENFDIETDLQEIDVDGRNITYYASPDVENADDDLSLYYFIIDLIPDGKRFATVQTMIINDDDTNTFDEAQLMEFVQSIELTEEAITEMNAPQAVECWDSGSSVTDELNDITRVTCPAGCNDTSGGIWGTEIYTDDSSICVAAIHMGLIDETGGDVMVTYAKGQEAYISTEANGILSMEYGSWGASFMVSAPENE